MQTITFTQKLLRQWRFASFLVPLLALLMSSQLAWAQLIVSTDNAITLTQQPTSSPSVPGLNYAGTANNAPYTTYTQLGNIRTTPVTTSPALGTYDLDGNSQLRLTKSTAVEAIYSPNTSIDAVYLQYRVYVSSSTQLPNFTSVPLVSIGSDTYEAAGLDVNLLSGLVNGGTYTLEVRYSITATRSTTTKIFTEPSGGTPAYTAVFSVTPPTNTPPNGLTNWISNGVVSAGQDANWFNGANWSNGVPTALSDVYIPDKEPSTAPTIAPQLDNNTASYEVRNLTIGGSTNSGRGIIRLLSATLKIYGNFVNGGSGLLAVTESVTNGNSTVVFAGGNQTITQGRIANVRIEGTGIKSVLGGFEVTSALLFPTGINALLRTSIVNGNGDTVLNTGSPTSVYVDLGPDATVTGETNSAFVLGILKANREVVQSVSQTFGNIGIDITVLGRADAGTGFITRTTGDPFFGPVNTSAVGIKRQYGVSLNNASNVNATVVFHYLNSVDNTNGAIDELNGNVESRLVMFRTANNGVPFQPLYGTVNTTAKTVTVNGIVSINTVTLADRDRPLPVMLTFFDAKRVGSDALVTWTTAQEQNNKGYNVQVSTDAKTYRTIGFVASETPNSSSAKSYSFTDTEKNKVGVRYYRLQQVDVDGKTAFFAPRAITFDGRATAAGLVAYPNPYTSELRVSLNSTVSGNATARITDMTGRVISQQVLPLTLGTNDQPIAGMSGLKTGLYMLNVKLPSGETQNLKVVKQ